MPTLDRDGDVLVLDLGGGENRLHPDWIASMDDALGELERMRGPRALVTTASGKVYSNGLDLDWLGAHDAQRDEYFAAVHGLLARLLALPVITVAAVQGHAFGAGAMVALAQDFRVMRADRGYWCLPEVNIGLAFPPAMAALVQSRLAPQVAHEAMVTGRRYGGEQALVAGIVDAAVAEEQVIGTAVELARTYADRAGSVLGAIKSGMYASALALLRDARRPFGDS